MLATIIIADDDQAFRSVLKPLLEKERELSVVGEAADGLEAIDRARALSPDIILMDLAMPRLNGLEARRTIKTERPGSTVVNSLQAAPTNLSDERRRRAPGRLRSSRPISVRPTSPPTLPESRKSFHRDTPLLPFRFFLSRYQDLPDGFFLSDRPCFSQRHSSLRKLFVGGGTHDANLLLQREGHASF